MSRIPSNPSKLQFAADVGGTFTDVIALDNEGGVWTHKLPSTPPDFEQAVLEAIEYMLASVIPGDRGGAAVDKVAHGTTVATNAVLEHRGAKTALITTRGFRDVLELRRIRAPQMYDLFWDKPRPLVERYLRLELSERLAADGTVIRKVDRKELAALNDHLVRERVESVAVCFLHAYAHPKHERIVGEYLRKHLPRELPGVEISLSSEVLRVRNEYERTATTVVNAYVRPVMKRYLGAMRGGLDKRDVKAPLLIMQSAGGLTPESDAAVRPVFALESGPAAGVLAASFIAKRLGIANVITLDIGGTTAKASLIEDGRIATSPEYEVGASLSVGSRLIGGGGERIMAPTIDIAEVGAGGGSIAYLDNAGGLHVGPRSAGAKPGPACYRKGGTDPTLTDADVVLGYIRPGKLANGDITIDVDAAHRAIHDKIAKPMNISVNAAAEGIHRIANARTMRALRAVSTERGRDPRDFVLFGFGGNGPVHAAGLANDLLVKRTIVPPLPGLFSAVGLLCGGIEHHDARSCRLSRESLTPAAMNAMLEDMRSAMLEQFANEGFAKPAVSFAADADVRFLGQASEIRVTIPSVRVDARAIAEMDERFKAEHERLYGHRSDPDNSIQVVAVRLVGSAGAPDANTALRPATVMASSVGATRVAGFGGKHTNIETPVVTRASLTKPTPGPLLIDEYDSTTVVPPGMAATLDAQNNIVLEAKNAR